MLPALKPLAENQRFLGQCPSRRWYEEQKIGSLFNRVLSREQQKQSLLCHGDVEQGVPSDCCQEQLGLGTEAPLAACLFLSSDEGRPDE